AIASPQLVTLSLRLNRVSSAEPASYSARRTFGSPALLIRPCTSIDLPDCHRRDVSPKYAATPRDRRNLVGSSIAVIKLSAVTGPTPGICMKPAQLMAGDKFHQQI